MIDIPGGLKLKVHLAMNVWFAILELGGKTGIVGFGDRLSLLLTLKDHTPTFRVR
jgi:hypothetical protein